MISWNSADCLKKLKSQSYEDRRNIRKEVYSSTMKISSSQEYISASGNKVSLKGIMNENALEDNDFNTKNEPLTGQEHVFDTIVGVVNMDCLGYAKTLHDEDSSDDLCVLNMASSFNPGGGVLNGSNAQEEYLFRCTDYWRFLTQYSNGLNFIYANHGIKPNKNYSYPLNGWYGGIFSHSVTVFRDTEKTGYALIDKPWNVNFIAVAAVNTKRDNNKVKEKNIEKIKTIFRLAYRNDQRRLVLGAFGCGVFKNSPYDIATLFKEALEDEEFKNIFKSVDFAIIEDENSTGKNFETFKKILE